VPRKRLAAFQVRQSLRDERRQRGPMRDAQQVEVLDLGDAEQRRTAE
jgi:hypothetical protein